MTNASFSALFGGYQNTIASTNSVSYSVIMGGTLNCIEGLAGVVPPFSVGAVYYNYIGGGNTNKIYTDNSNTATFSTVLGGLQNHIFSRNGTRCTNVDGVIGGGYQNRLCRANTGSTIMGGNTNTMNSASPRTVIMGGANITGGLSCYSYGNYLYKTSGSFSIRHPDPEKTHTHKLVHSFVEAPTTGENLYRFEVKTENCAASVTLPSYYKFLNCNDQVWITPKDHLGSAYGTVNADQTKINITSNCDESYYVLLLGTRKDEKAKFRWRGPEQDSIIPN